jgi:Cu-processing system permease protein
MTATVKVLKYELRDVARSRAIMVYAVFFLAVTELLFRFSTGPRALLSLASITLIVVPLVSLVLGTMFVYGAREFNELLLSQPVDRRQLFAGLYLGFVAPLALGYVVGVGIPAVLHAGLTGTLVVIMLTAVLLTAIFVAIAFALAMRLEDRVRGLGLGLVAWLLLAVVYDGLVMLAANAFWSYPLERPMLALMVLNPIDLGRVLILMRFDTAAMLGYTGAVFRDFFTGPAGIAVAMTALAVWLAAPLALGFRFFRRKDF